MNRRGASRRAALVLGAAMSALVLGCSRSELPVAAGSSGGASASSTPSATSGTGSSGVVPGAWLARPLAPLSTSTVSSQRPTLRWKLPPEADGAHVELCQDRACATVIVAWDALGNTTRPPVALAPGVVFWRLRGMRGGTIGTQASPTWQFHVGHRSAPADTSWGSVPDLNGDGFADVIVGHDVAHVYLGTAAGLSSEPVITLKDPSEIPNPFEFGTWSGRAGDVDGDGFADFFVGAGSVFVYRGGPNGLGQAPDFILENPSHLQNEAFATAMTSAGDINGDGYADLVIPASSAPYAEIMLPGGGTFDDHGPGRVYVYFGGTMGVNPDPMILNPPASATNLFGRRVASAGDFNGDGFADFVVLADSFDDFVYLYLGSAMGPSAVPVALQVPSDTLGTFDVASAGDMNGDGLDDFAVVWLSGALSVYLGNSAGASPLIVNLSNGSSSTLTLSSGGDINGDGFADLILGTSGESASVFLGSPTVESATPLPLLTPGPSTHFGIAVAGAGDINGDGFDDALVSSFGSGATPGAVYVYSGAAKGVSSPSLILTRPGADMGYFGGSLTSNDDLSKPPRAPARRLRFPDAESLPRSRAVPRRRPG